MVVATAALFFSLGGVSLAATGYLITSPSQIAPNVLKTIQRSTHSARPRGVEALGAGAPGFVATAAGPVAFSEIPGSAATTIVTRALPAGDYIVSGDVSVGLVDDASPSNVTVQCQLVDTPVSGVAVTDTDTWSALTDVSGPALPDSANNSLSFDEAVSSPSSPSSVSISCQTLADAPVGAESFTMTHAVVTAVQTASIN